MRFFEVMAELHNSSLDNCDAATKQSKKQNIARKSDAFFEEWEDRAGVFLVDMDTRAEFAVCLMGDEVDPCAVVEKFVKRLEMDATDFSVREISVTSYMGGLSLGCRNGFVSDDDQIMEKLGLDRLFNQRVNYFSDRVVDEDKTAQDLQAAVAKYHLSDGYKVELDRILSGETRAAFLGNPANYLMISKDEVTRRVTSRDLISALYSRGRLQSKRYTIIDLAGRGCTLESLGNFYKLNEGATLLLKVRSECFGEGEHARNGLDMRKVCDLVRKLGAKTLTIFSMDTPSDKYKAAIENYMMGIPLLTFSDNLYKKQAACEELLRLAAAENFTFSNEVLEKVQKTERGYSYGELVNLYNEWRAGYMSTTVFPEYSQFVTHLTEEEKQKVHTSDAYARLKAMVGLEQAKKVIDGAINYFKLQQEFRNRGIEFNRPAMHMCFTGSPGTAKTTVARLVAEILKDNGILSEGRLVEVGRSKLVGQFVGTTAPRVCEMFDEAKGSVLFIDEAYALVEDRKGLYGTEAINAIVQEMENRREDTIVILAGYPDEMNQLLEWNPGMKSRIAFHVSFDDYTEDELLEITRLLAKERGMLLEDRAEEKLRGIYAEARLDKGFGNGRFARNLLEKAKFNQANRFMGKDLQFISDEEMRTLTAEDFDYHPQKKAGNLHFGFCE